VEIGEENKFFTYILREVLLYFRNNCVKIAVSQKIAKNRANQAATGNIGDPLKLTEREQKILGIMGFNYVEGVQCPDAFPEKQVIVTY